MDHKRERLLDHVWGTANFVNVRNWSLSFYTGSFYVYYCTYLSPGRNDRVRVGIPNSARKWKEKWEIFKRLIQFKEWPRFCWSWGCVHCFWWWLKQTFLINLGNVRNLFLPMQCEQYHLLIICSLITRWAPPKAMAYALWWWTFIICRWISGIAANACARSLGQFSFRCQYDGTWIGRVLFLAFLFRYVLRWNTSERMDTDRAIFDDDEQVNWSRFVSIRFDASGDGSSDSNWHSMFCQSGNWRTNFVD